MMCPRCGHASPVSWFAPAGETDYCDHCGAMITIPEGVTMLGSMLGLALSIVVGVVAFFVGKEAARKLGFLS